ncbi:hypothetical protein CAPTEDRAFT_109952 [Capitella teleta]|uniref:Tetraspanin n=1 Tax=Capitella teleta TaxID=283909 RepID=R7TEW8_CAPTE|nr:hypothetical protein CAPTEDRAFT_109952 [Capitella teleta]|eukprot:ELT92274.1 hypothetical protein CAPTEDRAFT_109952 [Capitella teleta]
MDLAAEASQNGLLGTSIELLISVGVLMTLLVAMACCGAVHASRCMLRAFIFFVIFGCVIELISVAMAASFRNDAVTNLRSSLQISLTPERYYDAGEPRALGRLMNTVQQQAHCCGIDNATDYAHNGFPEAVNGTEPSFPYSCCVMVSNSGSANHGPEDVLNLEGCQDELENYFYSDGCADEVLSAVNGMSKVILLTGLVTLCLQVLSIVLAGCLWRAITKDYYY